jgi:hypothetical protein
MGLTLTLSLIFGRKTQDSNKDYFERTDNVSDSNNSACNINTDHCTTRA